MFWDGEKNTVADHTDRYPLAEFKNLASDVFEESVKLPLSHEHYHVDWCIVHEHGHGSGAYI